MCSTGDLSRFVYYLPEWVFELNSCPNGIQFPDSSSAQSAITAALGARQCFHTENSDILKTTFNLNVKV